MQETWVQSLGREDPWRRKWQPTPVFLPGKFHGQRSLEGYSPWGHKKNQTWLNNNNNLTKQLNNNNFRTCPKMCANKVYYLRMMKQAKKKTNLKFFLVKISWKTNKTIICPGIYIKNCLPFWSERNKPDKSQGKLFHRSLFCYWFSIWEKAELCLNLCAFWQGKIMVCVCLYVFLSEYLPWLGSGILSTIWLVHT